MGSLEDFVNQVTGEIGGGDAGHSAMANAVVEMLGSPTSGGLESLAQGFQDKGLGDVMGSWISTGPNQPIEPDQVQRALGSDRLGELAKAAGVSPDMAKVLLTMVLPLVIDKLTPNGRAASRGSMLEGPLGMIFKKFL